MNIVENKQSYLYVRRKVCKLDFFRAFIAWLLGLEPMSEIIIRRLVYLDVEDKSKWRPRHGDFFKDEQGNQWHAECVYESAALSNVYPMAIRLMADDVVGEFDNLNSRELIYMGNAPKED